MGHSELERLSREELIELVLRLQRPDKTSHTSSKPPSTDRKERRAQAKPGGAKPGHGGHSRVMSDDPDAVIDHCPDRCSCCGGVLHGDLPAEVVSASERIDLPEIAPVVTRHRRLAVRCPTCSARVVASVPDEARGTPFGPRLHAVATYLKTFQALSYERLQAALSDLFGLTLSQGGLMNLLRRAQARFRPGRDVAVSALRRAEVVASDETGVRIEGCTAYHWVFRSAEAVVHTASPTRGAAVVRKMMDSHRPAVWISDRYTAQQGHATAHQTCLAHLARDVAYAVEVSTDPGPWRLQDVLTCIREGCTIDAAGYRLDAHVDRHLKSPTEIARLFAAHPAAVARTLEIAERCAFSLDELIYQYPDEREDSAKSPQETLEAMTWTGARSRYPNGLPDEVALQLRHELTLIERFSYAPYFLTVNAIVRFARSRGILCQGRGSAANSAVCYVLGITAIDPVRQGLLFERFISEERREPPDIDVDFEHERREEVIQWVYETYGRDRAALCATVIRYRARGAVREVGKALGVPEDITGALAGLVWGWSAEGVEEKHAAELNLNLADRRLRLTLELARELIGTPRHLSQHPGGFVLTNDRLDELVPVEPASMADRQVIEWDKDDVEALKFMKVDVLGLGMLGCLRCAFSLLEQHKPGAPADLTSVPAEDAATYAMIRRADTVGVFQIESRAQMAMLPRMKPRTFYDLVIEVAVVRPGPIQGDMVHPYLRRREGVEPVTYPTPELERVLGKTLGVPLFQEQAMQVAIVAAGFNPSEADQLRRAMATFKFTAGVSRFRDKLIAGMVDNGYARDFAERTFKQLQGFGSYGFPESHAASFALIAYASSWLKCHHPDVYACAILNAQPMGFYAPAQLVRDAREHGVEVRPVCVNRSAWDCTLEPAERGPYRAVRLGLRMVHGLENLHGARLVLARGLHPYSSVEELWGRTGVPAAALRRLAAADTFRPALGLSRREALWAVRALAPAPLPLFAAADERDRLLRPELDEPTVALPAMTAGREVAEDYCATALSLRAHPLAFLRLYLGRTGYVRCAELAHARSGSRVEVAGLVLIRQRPGSAKGVLFITLEDETGIANLIVWPALFERQRSLVLTAGLMGALGRVQRQGRVVHLVAEGLTDLSFWLRRIGEFDLARLPTGRGDEARHGGALDQRDPVRRPMPDAAGTATLGSRPRDIFIPDPCVDEVQTQADEASQPAIRIWPRNFR